MPIKRTILSATVPAVQDFTGVLNSLCVFNTSTTLSMRLCLSGAYDTAQYIDIGPRESYEILQEDTSAESMTGKLHTRAISLLAASGAPVAEVFWTVKGPQGSEKRTGG